MKKSLIFCVIVVVMLMATGCSEYLEKYNAPVDVDSTETVMFTVPSGATTTSISKSLEADGLIQNANAFKSKVKQMAVDGQMKAGDYALSKSMTSEDIINKLVNGEIYEETFTFTIPEGYEIRQIVDKLEAEGLIDREVFLEALKSEPFDYPFLDGINREYLLEGYLFPDTYTLKAGSTEVQIIDRMLSRFNEVFKAEYYDRAVELDLTRSEERRVGKEC